MHKASLDGVLISASHCSQEKVLDCEQDKPAKPSGREEHSFVAPDRPRSKSFYLPGLAPSSMPVPPGGRIACPGQKPPDSVGITALSNI